jgi:hypothetical protein
MNAKTIVAGAITGAVFGIAFGFAATKLNDRFSTNLVEWIMTDGLGGGPATVIMWAILGAVAMLGILYLRKQISN